MAEDALESIPDPADRPPAPRSTPARFSAAGTSILLALLFASLASFVAFASLLWSYTLDDSFITFRYADNLVRGWGITFNQAPPRAEGYTSILWTFVMALPHLARIDAVLFSKLAGLALTLGTLAVMSWGIAADSAGLARRDRLAGIAFAAVLFLSFSSAPVHSVSGMETALAAFLYAVTAVSFLKALEGALSTPLLPLSCLALGLTRPEANLYAGALLGLLFFLLPVRRRLRLAAQGLAFYVLPGVAYFLWRSQYYGSLLPLPFYIKSATADLSGLEPTLSFLKNVLVGFAFPILMLAVSDARRKAWLLWPLAGMLAYFVTTDHIMGYGHRYFFPLLPVLSLLAGLGLVARIRAGIGASTQAAFVLCLGLAFTLGVVKTFQTRNGYLSYARGMETAHVLLGRALAGVPWHADPVLIIGDAGAVPYYSRLRTIDSYGLNDPVIAKNLRADRAEYVFGARPTLVVLLSWREHVFEPRLPHEAALWEAARARGYTRQVTLVFEEDYYLWVMWQPSDPEAARLESLLEAASMRNHELHR